MNSIEYGFSLVLTVFDAVLGWFSSILAKDGFSGYLIAVIFIILSYRFLLSPILDRGSDTAKKRGDDDD